MHPLIPRPTRRELLSAAAATVAAPASVWQARQRDDITAWSIREIQRALRANRVSPVEIVDAYLRRIEAGNSRINAFTVIARERALLEAQELTRQMRIGPRRALAGVPVAHKDLLLTRGVRTTGGSRLYRDWVPVTDAKVATRFTEAGAVMVGKTNTPEFGANEVTINDLFGETLNPRDTGRISGGSSGGSAAAVAAGLTLVATGTDTGGSTRAPAALCGCVGMKPTFGRLPTAGVLPFSPEFDHVGVMTRSVEDMAMVLDAILPADRERSSRPGLQQALSRGVRGLRIGVPRAYFFAGGEPEVLAAVESAIRALARLGATVRDVDLGVSASDEACMALIAHHVHAKYDEADPDVLSDNIREWVEYGRRMGPAEVESLRLRRRDFEQRVVGTLTDVDALVTPTTPIVAPPVGTPTQGRVTRNTWPFNVARVPALSLPCGTGAAGLPVGLQIAGRPNDEATVVAIGAAVESVSR